MTPRRARAGFTFFEVVVAGAIAGVLFLLFGQSFTTSSRMGATAHVELMAHDTARRSLDALANVLRGAYWDELGLDDAQPSTAVTFQRVTGVAESGAAVLGPPERVEWRASAAVDGIARAGNLVHVRGGAESVIAPRVPEGGFRAQLDGTLLLLTLTTFHGVDRQRTSQVTVSCAVALRN